MNSFSRDFLNITGALLALALVVLLGLAMRALLIAPVPASNHDVLLIVLTVLSTNITAIVAFYFGSSASNKKQADTINAQANTIASAAAPQPSTAAAGADAATKPGDTQ